MEVSLKHTRIPDRRKAIHLLFWIVITLIFLYDRRYLIQKAGLDNFIECVVVRVTLIVALAYANLYYLIPRYFSKRKYVRYFLYLLLLILAYVSLQHLYDIFLFGYVIGDVPYRAGSLRGPGFFKAFSYNFIVTGWYILLTVALKLSLEWFSQKKELKKLQTDVALLAKDGETDRETGKYIFLKTGTKLIRTNVDRITHVQGLKDYSLIFTSGERIIVKGSLKTVEEMLPGRFLRVHKSFMVAKDKITLLKSNMITAGTYQIPVGRNYKQQVADFINAG